jgi:hypothetical protein
LAINADWNGTIYLSGGKLLSGHKCPIGEEIVFLDYYK